MRPRTDPSGPVRGEPRVRETAPGSNGASPTTILLISDYAEDTRALVKIATELARHSSVRPIFLITTTGEPADRAADLVRKAGFEVFDVLPLEDAEAGLDVRSPFRRARLIREANAALSARIMKQTGARAILYTADTARGHFIRTANDLGIPSLFVQWTEIYNLELRRAWRQAEVRWSDSQFPAPARMRRRVRRTLNQLAGLHRPWNVAATRVAVAGPFYRDVCIEAGVEAERIEITGTLQCDEMHRYAGLSEAELSDVKESIGLGRLQPFLLYALEYTPRLYHLDPQSASEAEQRILAAMRTALPHFARVVKLHPRHGAEDAARVRAFDPEAIVVGGEVSIGGLVAAAAELVSTVSSSLMWAVGIDRPVISAYFWEGVDEFKRARELSGVEHADTVGDLVVALRKNVQDDEHMRIWRSRRAECRDRYLRVDGKGLTRIVDAFLALLPSAGAATADTRGR